MATHHITRRHYWPLVAFAIVAMTLSVIAPRAARAQDSAGVYDPEDVHVPPKFASKSKIANIVKYAYPERLKQAGIEGTAQVACIVGTDGKVEPGSVQIVMATVPAFGAAAKEAVEKFEFKPGMVKGTAVRVRTLVPLVFKLR
jgi:TonB family protein